MMDRKSRFRIPGLICILCIAVFLGCEGEPPEEGAKRTGPAVNGTLVINSDGFGAITTFSFSGKCSGADIEVENSDKLGGDPFPLTAEALRFFKFIEGGQIIENACMASGGTLDDPLIVNNVKKFTIIGGQVIAEVNMHWEIPK